MPDKVGIFVEADVANPNEPATHASTTAAASTKTADKGTKMVRRRCGRPRKVVVYYFDSDAENDEGVADAVENDSITSQGEELTSLRRCGPQNSPEHECCCSHCGHRRAPAQKRISPENPRIGSPTPLGFFAFGMTTLLYNVHNANICRLNMATMGLILIFGGLTQFVCGFFELINRNTLGCTISTTYGAFWGATAVLFLWPESSYVERGDNNYMGGFFLLWFVFASSLFASSFRSPFTCMALLFLVPLNFLLQSIGFFLNSNTVAHVAGYLGIIIGALATYLGMAFTLRDVYGRSMLPILFQKRMRYVEW
ncbi:conserved hypothetical protein [Leishmania major strain Friedlin]|uniref:GPR1/FUN34/yaaH family n=1 Tax=Leishmania major TaxID=5664 RepID=E9ACI2_LEIMA|nr:conserved hypothetical protein [Leishmania major strain Friedlin]CAG9567262.1 GPR1/FUN34/yaaH_family_-_putative [Leishmania major strain Friedlin]CBZ11999.1 conserved hypothetical protein [Leishmania major strain Friedlin]|eukprot:XP_003721713.1 conserved hypothetical protein [Leishmania major strain Friedlin]